MYWYKQCLWDHGISAFMSLWMNESFKQSGFWAKILFFFFLAAVGKLKLQLASAQVCLSSIVLLHNDTHPLCFTTHMSETEIKVQTLIQNQSSPSLLCKTCLLPDLVVPFIILWIANQMCLPSRRPRPLNVLLRVSYIMHRQNLTVLSYLLRNKVITSLLLPIQVAQ